METQRKKIGFTNRISENLETSVETKSLQSTHENTHIHSSLIG